MTRASTGCATSPACPSPPTSRARRSRWLLDNVDGARERAENGELLFGTTDTWVLWNLTGGTDGGIHVTDVTNASRTLLMDLETLDWHEPALDLMGVPRSMLPEIKSSSEHYGDAKGSAIGGRPLAGILGDQQAALFGQTCFEPGDAKNTYGTGSFLLVNTGEEIVRTDDLLTTVGYKLGDGKADLRARGLDRGHRLADPVAARPAGDHRRRRPRSRSWPRPSTTTAASTSSRRSRACSPRTGATTPAA